MNFIKNLFNWFKKVNVDKLPTFEDIIGEEITMDFVLIEVTDGGANITDCTKQEIINILKSNPEWIASLKTFESYNWSVGEWMEYPCGWMFCVSSKDPIN